MARLACYGNAVTTGPATDNAATEFPLFPLPGLVVFPGMTLPLYIFEERYRKMVKLCVESNQRRIVIVMALPPPELTTTGLTPTELPTGLAAELSDGPDVPSTASVGTFVDILSVMENADGSSNILTHGQGRCYVKLSRSEPIVTADGSLSYLHFSENLPHPLERSDPNLERIASWDALEVFREYATRFFADDARQQLEDALPDDLLFQASFICANLRLGAEARQLLLEAPTLSERFAAAQRSMQVQLDNPPSEKNSESLL